MISATGNITGNYFIGNGSLLTGLPATYGNSNVNTLLAAWGSNALSTTGNVTASYYIGNGSLLSSLTGANVSGIVANATYATSAGSATTATSATTAGTVTTAAQPNITSVGILTSVSVSGNATVGNVLTGGLISATSNITGGNILTAGQVSTVGNLYLGTGNAGYVYGNGTYLTGISAAISVSKIENGNSNVWVQTAGGDVTVTAGGVSNVAVFSTGSMTLQGAFGTPKTITSNIVVAGGINAMLIGPMVFGNGYNLTVPTSSTVYIYAP